MSWASESSRRISFASASASNSASQSQPSSSVAPADAAKIKALIAAADAITVPRHPLVRKSSIDRFQAQVDTVDELAEKLPAGSQLQAMSIVAQKHRTLHEKLTGKSLHADDRTMQQRVAETSIPAKYIAAFQEDTIKQVAQDLNLYVVKVSVRTIAKRNPTLDTLPLDRLQEKLNMLDLRGVQNANRDYPNDPVSYPRQVVAAAAAAAKEQDPFDLDF